MRADVVEAVLARAGAIPRDKQLAAEFLVGGAGNLIEQLVALGFDAALVLDAASEASGIPIAPSLWLDGVPRTARGVDAGLARRLGALVLGDIDGSLCIAYVDVEVAAAHDAYGFAPHEPFLCLARDLPTSNANADFLVDATIDGSVDATIDIARLRAEVDEPTLPIAAPSSTSTQAPQSAQSAQPATQAPQRPAPTFGPPAFEPFASLDPPLVPLSSTAPVGSTPPSVAAARLADLDPALPPAPRPAPSSSSPSSSPTSSSTLSPREEAAALAPRDLTRPLLAGVLGAAVVAAAMLLIAWPDGEAPAPAIAVNDGAVDVDARQAALLAQAASLDDDAAIALLSRGIALDPNSAGALPLLVERARRYQHTGAAELCQAEVERIARRADAPRVQGALDELRAAARSAPVDGSGVDRQSR